MARSRGKPAETGICDGFHRRSAPVRRLTCSRRNPLLLLRQRHTTSWHWTAVVFSFCSGPARSMMVTTLKLSQGIGEIQLMTRRHGGERPNRRKAQAPAALVQYFGSSGGAHSSHAEGMYFQQGVERADATGCFHLHRGWRVAAHEPEVGERRTAGSVAGGGLHPVNTDLTADFAQANLGSVIEVCIFKDDFDFRTGGVSHRSEAPNLGIKIFPVAAAGLADVD